MMIDHLLDLVHSDDENLRHLSVYLVVLLDVNLSVLYTVLNLINVVGQSFDKHLEIHVQHLIRMWRTSHNTNNVLDRLPIFSLLNHQLFVDFLHLLHLREIKMGMIKISIVEVEVCL